MTSFTLGGEARPARGSARTPRELACACPRCPATRAAQSLHVSPPGTPVSREAASPVTPGRTVPPSWCACCPAPGPTPGGGGTCVYLRRGFGDKEPVSARARPASSQAALRGCGSHRGWAGGCSQASPRAAATSPRGPHITGTNTPWLCLVRGASVGSGGGGCPLSPPGLERWCFVICVCARSPNPANVPR